MNKSRRMAAMQSRALAAFGCEVLQVDLAGCGDSSGDFGSANWTDWVDDVARAVEWLYRHPHCTPNGDTVPLWLWGHRVGGLVAAQALQRLSLPASMLFWQPVISGKVALQQFLRLRVAGAMLEGDAKGLMNTLKGELAAHRPVEVAGYRLSPELARGLEQATLGSPPGLGPSMNDPIVRRAVWIEISTQPEAKTTPAVAAAAARWHAAGWASDTRVAAGPAFWQVTEIEDAPALIDVTLDVMQCHLNPANPVRAA